MKNLLRNFLIITFLGLTACLSIKDSTLRDEAEINDYLVYLIDEHPKPQKFMMYDPVSNVHTQILPDWDIDQFNLSINNRLAFSLRDGDGKIYIADYPFKENYPIAIPVDGSSNSTPLSWSPDGHYLLFHSVKTDNKTLSLWDGKSVLDILEYQETISETAWSSSGHLAFTEFYDFYGRDPNATREWGSSEVFIWDGNAVVSVSQNPSGEDRYPAWSKDGKLAFVSTRNEESDIFVWDGKSKNNAVPDINTFTNIAPSFTGYYSAPTWTSSNTLAFTGSDVGDAHVQIYEWDGQTATNISQNASAHNTAVSWRSDGYWAFITFFSSSRDLYIRDHANQTVLKTRGESPAWSQKGLLIFCVRGDSDWLLSLWNGKNVIEITQIAHGGSIRAGWNNGEGASCSDG